jgi:hypothetical protein
MKLIVLYVAICNSFTDDSYHVIPSGLAMMGMKSSGGFSLFHNEERKPAAIH